ncbi:MAG: TolC family protein [Taibaiella sp.]|nr:TolC family protein [Taibaiella sp.]
MHKRRNRTIFLLLLMCFPYPNYAIDSLKVLTKDALLSIVRSYHPVVVQAGLQVKRAEAEIQKARGSFDPTIGADLNRKSFDGKEYYSYFNPEIVIPTWYGVEVKGGLEEIGGTRVTEEATMGKTSYVGVKVPANSLVFDKRRAMLQQAQSMGELSVAERRLAINDLLLDALYAYWNWVKEYRLYSIISNVVTVNEERIKFVKTEYEQGARPAIDTIEALAQLQSFYLQQNAAFLSFANAGLELSNYLWTENNAPLLWSNDIMPDTDYLEKGINQDEVPALDELLSTVYAHPKIQGIGFKIDFLSIDKKLKAQYLLPKLNISANMLNKGYAVSNDWSATFLENNHKLGVDLSMPLFFREARGGYKAASLKLQEATVERSLTELVVENKIKGYYNEIMALRQQVTIFNSVYINYQKLFTGERLKFAVGESSLFILNSRENKLLETNQKLIELKAKWHKSYAGLLWSAGTLQ